MPDAIKPQTEGKRPFKVWASYEKNKKNKLSPELNWGLSHLANARPPSVEASFSRNRIRTL